MQDVAIRCIQRNVRKLQAIRVWPWWRLMLRLSPLLNVHRTEEELKARTVIIVFYSLSFFLNSIILLLYSANYYCDSVFCLYVLNFIFPLSLLVMIRITQEEAESLRSRVTALEKERADLKYIADRLETKVTTP